MAAVGGQAVLQQVSEALAGWKEYLVTVDLQPESEDVVSETAQAFITAGVMNTEAAVGVLDSQVLEAVGEIAVPAKSLLRRALRALDVAAKILEAKAVADASAGAGAPQSVQIPAVKQFRPTQQAERLRQEKEERLRQEEEAEAALLRQEAAARLREEVLLPKPAPDTAWSTEDGYREYIMQERRRL